VLDQREAAQAKRKARRGVAQIDFGLAAKVRPALILGCDIADEDRVLVTVVCHTTALRDSRYEVPLRVPGLDAGGFDAQSLYTVPGASRQAPPAAGGIDPRPTEANRGSG